MGQERSSGLFSLIYILVVVIVTLVLLVLKVQTICDSCWLFYLFIHPLSWVLIFAGSCCFLTMKSVIKSLLRKANLCVSDKEVESNFPFDTSET